MIMKEGWVSMKMKGRKATVFISSTIIFVSLYVVTLFIYPQVLSVVGSMLIGAITLMGMTFIGGNIYAQFLKSKYYNADLDGRD